MSSSVLAQARSSLSTRHVTGIDERNQEWYGTRQKAARCRFDMEPSSSAKQYELFYVQCRTTIGPV
jgi:hypothetical protein